MARTPETVNDTMRGQEVIAMEDFEEYRQCLLRGWRGRWGGQGAGNLRRRPPLSRGD